MGNIIATTAIGLCTLYVSLIILFSIGLLRRLRSASPEQPNVSIIVPARNEAHNLDACLNALSAQTYPAHQFEIIIVDDRSTDETANKIRAWQTKLSNLHGVSVEQQEFDCPKKNALWQGIKQAHHDIVFTTDADCRPGPNWLSSTIVQFASNIGMVIGHAPLIQEGKTQSLLSLQALIVSILAAGSAGIGFPLTCTGRNLAFRRQSFDEANGYSAIGHIIGGDDVLLMNQIINNTSWKIRFNADPKSYVPSAPHPDNLLDRQVRYQSKTIHYAIPTLILATAIYIFHAILLALPLAFFLSTQLLHTIGFCLITKIMADAVLLLLGAHKFKSLKLLMWFPVLEILIVPYIVIICALGTFSPFKWK